MERYSELEYPEEILNILNDLADIYSKYCETVVLYGSTSRNELVYIEKNGKIDFVSDIEFIVIPRDNKNANNKAFRKYLTKLSDDYFIDHPHVVRPPHIDVHPVSIEFFVHAQNRISTFELKSTGIVIKGNPVIDMLPDVNAENYDGKIQNIEIIKNLKILMIESNQWFLCSDNHSKEYERYFRSFLASSYLNILRTLLPQFGIFEYAGSERVKKVKAIAEYDKFQKYFTKESIELFNSIYIQKKTADFSYSPEQLFNITYDSYKQLLEFLMEENSDEDLITKIENHKEQLFDGSMSKIDLLAKLTKFFIASLDNIKKLINGDIVTNTDVDKMKELYDDLICGERAYDVMNIINDYTRMERIRWDVIGSKA